MGPDTPGMLATHKLTLTSAGVPDEVLVDNPKPQVARHDPVTREVDFNERFVPTG